MQENISPQPHQSLDIIELIFHAAQKKPLYSKSGYCYLTNS